VKKRLLSFSICIPVYKGSSVLRDTLTSIIKQSFNNYEIIIGDDNPPQLKEEIKKTKQIIQSFNNKRIKYIKHEKNLGCQENMNRIVSRAKNEIIYLVAQDDIITSNSLQITHDAFFLDKDIGAVTRGYFWFDDNIKKPVRLKKPVDQLKNIVVSVFDDSHKVIGVFNTVDNITGLAFRKKYLTTPFHQDMFTTHVYPFAAIFKNHKVVCLKDYIFACRIRLSQSRKAFSYIKSPMQSWIDMFNTVFREKKFEKIRQNCITNFVAVNYVGLVQIRNYARYRDLVHEIFLLIKYRWSNLFVSSFWFYALTCLVLPPPILIPLVDWYKNKVLSKKIPRISFKYFK